jgi:hypothetical protein
MLQCIKRIPVKQLQLALSTQQQMGRHMHATAAADSPTTVAVITRTWKQPAGGYPLLWFQMMDVIEATRCTGGDGDV